MNENNRIMTFENPDGFFEMELEFQEEPKVVIYLTNPVYASDVLFNKLRKRIQDCYFSICEIHIPEGGNVYSSEDGKMIFHRMENGKLRLGLVLTGLDHLEVPDGVFEIGYNACSMADFRSVFLPDSVCTIEKNAFSACRKMEKIRLSNELLTIGDYAFDECVSLRGLKLKKIYSIGYRAFQDCKRLKEIELPEGLEFLDEEAFMSCDDLTEISLPASLKSIGKNSMLHAQTIYLNGYVPDLIKALIPKRGSDLETVNIYLGEKAFVFPRHMSRQSYAKAEAIWADAENMEPGVYGYHYFAKNPTTKRWTALGTLLLSEDERTRAYVQYNAESLLEDAARYEEEFFLQIVDIFSKKKIFSSVLINMALTIANDKEWTQTKAELLQILSSEQRKNPKFVL